MFFSFEKCTTVSKELCVVRWANSSHDSDLVDKQGTMHGLSYLRLLHRLPFGSGEYRRSGSLPIAIPFLVVVNTSAVPQLFVRVGGVGTSERFNAKFYGVDQFSSYAPYIRFPLK